MSLDTGGLQQYTLVGSAPNLTVKLPDNISYDDAATLPIAFNTIRAAFYDPDQSFGFPFPFEGGESYGKGKAVLVVGGSSQVGLAGTYVDFMADVKLLNSFASLASLESLPPQPRNMKLSSRNSEQLISLIDLSLRKLKSNKSSQLRPTLNIFWTQSLTKRRSPLQLSVLAKRVVK